jgi:hypothetical protein
LLTPVRPQVLPHVCSDMLDGALPQLTSAALRLGQVLRGGNMRG